MKIPAFFLMFCLTASIADSSDKQEVRTKSTPSPQNTITPTQKYEMLFEPIKYQPQNYNKAIQQQPQYIPIQIVPRQYYQPQPMIIIAQPALVPSSLLYGSQTQQLLNYFHSNPLAKFQLLYGNQPQAQQYVVPTQSTLQEYQAAQYQPQEFQITQHQTPTAQYQPPTAQYQVQAAQYQPQSAQYQPQSAQQQTQSAQYQSQQLGLAQLAQFAAQQYASSPSKSTPAIVTGFENFTPKQQAQIKAQLSTHLGSDFQAVTAPVHNTYSSKYVAAEADNEQFVPSPQIKAEPTASTTTTASSRDSQRGRYVKG